MVDVHDKKIRSYNMSRIRDRDTKPELLVRKYLFGKGFRYKLNDRLLPGKPDLVFPRYKTIIFIHGCFWHGHTGCKYFVNPKTRSKWWLDKINRNKQVDARNVRKLKSMGWRIIIVFECRLMPKKREKTLKKLPTMVRL